VNGARRRASRRRAVLLSWAQSENAFYFAVRGESRVRTLLLGAVAIALVGCGFAWDKPWLWGLGLLVGLGALFGDSDPVELDGRDHGPETPMGVRKMRNKGL